VALNTIFHDNEIEAAAQLVHQLYDAEVDALIVQDMGLLEMDLPPIQLHASTQTDIRTVEKAQFLDQVGFSQMVLAREMDLNTVQAIAKSTTANLEYFVHGALCVAFSGQCFISHAHTGRSANRGECSQECRLPYDLEDQNGRIIGKNKHYLSMKDNDQSQNIRALVQAGVSSFKIEGRYKDAAYVKNTTAYYRQLIDAVLEEMPDYARSSAGVSDYTFTPQPEKTFNRSATDYFTNGRQADIGAFDTPKFAGDALGKTTKIGKDFIEVATEITLHNGDGVCFFDVHKVLVGLRVNTVKRVNGKQRLYPNEMIAGITPNMTLYRNRDHHFMRLLEKDSATRKLAVDLNFYALPEGFGLTMTDSQGFSAYAQYDCKKQAANNPEAAAANIKANLNKLGNTDFAVQTITLEMTEHWFVPASVVNQLRREAVESLVMIRKGAYTAPTRREKATPPAIYPEDSLSYLANIYNQKARDFYHKHGVKLMDKAYEANETLDEVPVMITKHCLRFSHGLCPKESKGVIGVQGTVTAKPMTLVSGNDRYTLKFDCKPCEMHVMGQVRPNILKMPEPQVITFTNKR